jgi:hypothetical protein
MRVFVTTTVQIARETLKNGFTGRYSLGEHSGVYVGERVLDIKDGFDGQVTLCVNIPVGVFNCHEEIEGEPDSSHEIRTGRALIPAAVLNQFDPPQLYDHEYAGLSRRELLQAIDRAPFGEPSPRKAMKEAFDFFEEVGWMAPVRLQEEQAEMRVQSGESGKS